MSRLDRVREIVHNDEPGFCSVGSPRVQEPDDEIQCPVDECEECIFNAYPEVGLQDLVRILDE